jgi:hypothetical protein
MVSAANQNMYRWIQTRNGCKTNVETLVTFRNAYRLAQPEGPLTHWHIKMFMPAEAELREPSTTILISYADRRDAAGDYVANYIQWIRGDDEPVPEQLPVPAEHKGKY